MEKPSAVVLVSGGLDSSVNLYQAVKEFRVFAVSFNYGQRAAAREVATAEFLCRDLRVPHKTLALPWLKDFGGSALIDSNRDIPTGVEVRIDDLEVSRTSAKAVWVANRNGIFLNIAAGYAEALGADWVIPGFNREEAATFPDNSAAFMNALDRSFSYSTANGVRVKCYTVDMDKTQIVRRGRELGLPLDRLWPCYFDGPAPCGRCESCQRFTRALREA